IPERLDFEKLAAGTVSSQLFCYNHAMSSGAVPTYWYEPRNDWSRVEGEVIEEALISIYVNGVELATIMATPQEQDLLALGFMKNEGLIDGLAEIEILHISSAGCCVDVWLNRPFVPPERVIVTSGCGGGVTFTDPTIGIQPLTSSLRIEPELLPQNFRKLQPPNSLYARSRGVHAAGLLDPKSGALTAIVEDVGRHNTIDKLMGCCLKHGIETREKVLLVTGRTSSEMLRKAALMGCPIVASRTSPTSLSVEMARAWNLTLVGYVRSGSMRIYSHPERMGYNTPK
ncbi:MAG: formate dehydrogenase accessory sulfurtransferase FdhD, partial [Anaerolineales bacterium]|nr:formate dehydrogenase accessory sulfurtransferase FdhD [Anaerolineales bacterium]